MVYVEPANAFPSPIDTLPAVESTTRSVTLLVAPAKLLPPTEPCPPWMNSIPVPLLKMWPPEIVAPPPSTSIPTAGSSTVTPLIVALTAPPPECCTTRKPDTPPLIDTPLILTAVLAPVPKLISSLSTSIPTSECPTEPPVTVTVFVVGRFHRLMPVANWPPDDPTVLFVSTAPNPFC